MAEVALANEYGTDVIPARPFVRPAFDHNLEALSKLKAELATAVQHDAAVVFVVDASNAAAALPGDVRVRGEVELGELMGAL